MRPPYELNRLPEPFCQRQRQYNPSDLSFNCTALISIRLLVCNGRISFLEILPPTRSLMFVGGALVAYLWETAVTPPGTPPNQKGEGLFHLHPAKQVLLVALPQSCLNSPDK